MDILGLVIHRKMPIRMGDGIIGILHGAAMLPRILVNLLKWRAEYGSMLGKVPQGTHREDTIFMVEAAALPLFNPFQVSVAMGQAAFRMQIQMQKTAVEASLGTFQFWRDAFATMTPSISK